MEQALREGRGGCTSFSVGEERTGGNGASDGD